MMILLNRRSTLGMLGAVPVGAAAPAQAQGEPARFTLLLLNDIYRFAEERGRGGFARVAAMVKAERARGLPVLFAHAGDCYSPSLMSGFDQGAHIVEFQNRLGIDVFVPGNHEFDFGKEIYAKRVSEQTYPTFCANLRDAEGKVLPGHEDHRIFELAGIKVGVVGLGLPTTPLVSSPGDLRFLPVMETLQAQVKLLRAAGADMIVAVTHTDRRTDQEIVRSRLCDVVLSGHDHDLAIGYDGRTVMVESNEEGYFVTAVEITATVRTEGNRRRISWQPAFRVNDSRTVTPDADMLALVRTYEAGLSRELDVTVATLGEPLDSSTKLVRSSETAIGNLLADAMRAATRADVALTNGGGIRGNRQYPAGHALSRRDILTELPFGNRTVVTEITGRDLKAALENGVSQIENRAGRFPHVSGLTLAVDPKAPVGSRVSDIKINGEALDLTRIYRVATNDFLLRGGDGYTALSGPAGRDLDVQGALMANDLMSHARRLGTISARVEGRIAIR